MTDRSKRNPSPAPLERLRRRKGPPKAPCETPTELLDSVAGPAKLDLPVLGSTTRSSEMKTCFKRQHLDEEGILARLSCVLGVTRPPVREGIGDGPRRRA